MYTVIDGNCFKNMLVGAYQLFQKKYEIINQLNVFPVPDGDTGNNMLNTLKSMYSMIAEVSPEEPVGIIAEKASAGAIMGARGNSGVILSQIIHGISRGLHGKKTASCGQMSKAFQYGILYAYRAVTKPVEGTILSVARGIAKGTHDVYRVETDFSKILEASIDAGEEALAKTPEQLQILKDANVVDAGGQGLIFFLMGCLNGLTGKVEDIEVDVKPVISRLEAKGESFSIEYPYCTEFIISPCKVSAREVRQKLSSWGESMIVASGDNLVKVHIHAQRPGHVLDMAADWGTLHDIKCDNMVDQFHRNKEKQQKMEKKPLGILTVVSGEGWTELFDKSGCDVVSGGQSMNPSVQELSAGMENGQYEKYIILPNNKNIILAAQQLKKMLGEKVHIVPSTNPMEGLAAAMVFDGKATIAENLDAMADRLSDIRSGMITTAVRDSIVGESTIHKDDFMGLVKGCEVISVPELSDCFMQVLGELIDEDTEIVTIYYGKDLSEEEKQEFISIINDNTDLLLKLVNDVLELSRIESGNMSFNYREESVRSLLNSIYNTHQLTISSPLKFIKEFPEGDVFVHIDNMRMTQVITNFLNNAKKFTKSGHIKLGYHHQPASHEVHIFVEDTGAGIPKEELQIIFDRFYKHNEFAQGVGLGLSICKVIVEKMQGRIEVTSEINKGSRFTVVLPCL